MVRQCSWSFRNLLYFTPLSHFFCSHRFFHALPLWFYIIGKSDISTTSPRIWENYSNYTIEILPFFFRKNHSIYSLTQAVIPLCHSSSVLSLDLFAMSASTALRVWCLKNLGHLKQRSVGTNNLCCWTLKLFLNYSLNNIIKNILI